MEAVKALIVEDERIVALDLKSHLDRLGFQVSGMAADAKNTFALLERNLPDVILMDIHIQGDIDGIELTKKINQSYDIPVVYLTAYSEDTIVKRATKTHPYGYLLKPFSERELNASIRVAVKKHQAEKIQRQKQRRLEVALESANLSAWQFDGRKDDILIEKNQVGEFREFKDWQQLYSIVIDKHRATINDAIDYLHHNAGAQTELEFQVIDENHEVRWLKLYGKSFAEKHQAYNKVVGVLQDITERHMVEEQLMEAATVFRCTAEGIAILNQNQEVESINDALANILGYSIDDLCGQALPIFQNIEQQHLSEEELWEKVHTEKQWQCELNAKTKSNQNINLLVNIGLVPFKLNTAARYIVTLSDITALRETQNKLSQIAYYDGLTGLPNRTLLLDRFRLALSKAERQKSNLAVLFIDLDHFKRVNDTYGHQTGDKMLTLIARRLQKLLRKSDTISRIGGDEFLVIIESFESHDDVETLAIKLIRAIQQPLTLQNIELMPSASIGISVFPCDAKDRQSLIQKADTAMYAAKNKGRNQYAFYQTTMAQHTTRYLLREKELRQALANDEFELYFQPVYRLPERTIFSVEALIRWHHKDKGLLPANEIIPFAEMSSLIVDIGQWVIKVACQQIRQWHQLGIHDIKVAINASSKQFTFDNLPVFISELLYDYRMSPRQLSIELTESCLHHDEQVLNAVKQLSSIGVSISLDDFGTGYSSLSSLKTLPVDTLKIDRSFVRDIPNDKDACAIAAAIMAMGHQLNKTIVAEGLESQAQIDFLQRHQCHYYQGFYFDKPMSSKKITTLLKSKQEKTRNNNESTRRQ